MKIILPDQYNISISTVSVSVLANISTVFYKCEIQYRTIILTIVFQHCSLGMNRLRHNTLDFFLFFLLNWKADVLNLNKMFALNLHALIQLPSHIHKQQETNTINLGFNSLV